MTIHIEEETKIPFAFDYSTLIERVVVGALDYIGCPYEAEVNVLLTDNAAIRDINRENREIDAATDVLSFPNAEYEVPGNFDMLEDEQPEVFHPDTGELMLGDIVISVERVLSQAEEFGHSTERELGFLTAHSVLHLCGFDHMEEDERVVMEEKQREIMDSLKLYR
ncbi:MAG: rRNA maturation RNase YbeY [Lachnospiraceae bacterium]|nr:rRNA maturation RNase YbeY [Lachnospiraceae bacterium]